MIRLFGLMRHGETACKCHDFGIGPASFFDSLVGGPPHRAERNRLVVPPFDQPTLDEPSWWWHGGEGEARRTEMAATNSVEPVVSIDSAGKGAVLPIDKSMHLIQSKARAHAWTQADDYDVSRSSPFADRVSKMVPSLKASLGQDLSSGHTLEPRTSHSKRAAFPIISVFVSMR